jgi:general secretion pathway protein A
MYRHFYKFTAMPFEISPDPKFLWLGEKQKEGLAAVRYGILTNAGFLSLTGDVGTGKTTLVNALTYSLKDNINFVKIPDPYLNTLDFFNFAANAFEMNQKFNTKGKFLNNFKDFLFSAYAGHKKVLLIIEEAQILSQALLEEVRLLSNIEEPNAKLMSTLFVGQNEFNAKLKKNRALQQRVNIRYHIQPLTEVETKAYIRHRLRIAGSETGIFSQGAIHEVYAFSKGNPRLINVVCDLALLSGYLKETKIIEAQVIRDCAAEYEISHQKKADFIEGRITPAPSIQETAESTEPATFTHLNQEASEKDWSKPGRRRTALFAFMLLLIFACGFGYLYYFSGNNASVANHTSQNDPGAARLSRLQTGYDALAVELKALKGTQERVAELEDEIKKSKKEIVQLQRQLTDLKTKHALGRPPSIFFKMPKNPQPAADAPKKEAKPLISATAIDSVLEKKSE